MPPTRPGPNASAAARKEWALSGGGQSFGQGVPRNQRGGATSAGGARSGGSSLEDRIGQSLAGIGSGAGGANALNAYGLDSPADWQQGGNFPLSRAITRLPGSIRYPNQGPDEPYYQGAATALLRSMPAEERARLQELMLAVGLTNSVIRGEIDDGTVSGFERLLGIANRRGERWQTSITRLRRALDTGAIENVGPGGAGGGGGAGVMDVRDPFRFVEQEYLPPDPAEVRNSIRELAKQMVPDVELDDAEVDYLRSQFESFGKEQFEASEHQRLHDARAEYDASAPIDEGDTDPDDVIVRSEGVQQVSAADRFREYFEKRYGPNIERREGQEEELGRRQVTSANLSSLMAFATGRN
jgi:hypothetical protein